MQGMKREREAERNGNHSSVFDVPNSRNCHLLFCNTPNGLRNNGFTWPKIWKKEIIFNKNKRKKKLIDCSRMFLACILISRLLLARS